MPVLLKAEPEVNSNHRMTSSVERREQVWVVLGNYTIYMNHIWYTAQETDNHHDRTCQIHLSLKSKMAAAAVF